MKKRFLLAALINLSFSALFAQKAATWQGGTPGQTDRWDCPKNWREGRVPDQMSDVVVPDCSTAARPQPVIAAETGPINSLRIESGATLAIETTGVLVVFERLEVLGAGRILNAGTLVEPHPDPHLKKMDDAKHAAKIQIDVAAIAPKRP